ncbi:hypothetical protein QFW96_21725 [Saccharopolyspora sp. TS4A08]|uniref:Uncharacterized protein n=1 Tax=Saccharopolyspora ipomoeae TaxID=3042027 RepID=A0ABT6PTC7_9PSEU|nr:hypothetical protein [Saccharopolyspora sp. TS4A08]MDI2031263.1 hypothetical protein [Saccharopolyspora sp. TS4A08]
MRSRPPSSRSGSTELNAISSRAIMAMAAAIAVIVVSNMVNLPDSVPPPQRGG